MARGFAAALRQVGLVLALALMPALVFAQTDDRKPVPGATDRAASAERIKELFKSDIAEAQNSTKRSALAKKLREIAGEDENDAQRFALLDQARQLAAAAFDFDLAEDISRDLSTQFKVDELRLAQLTLSQAMEAGPTPQQISDIAEKALTLIDDALAAENLAIVPDLGKVASSAAKKIKDVELQKRVTAVGERYKAVEAARAAMQAAQQTLKKNPDDPAANLTVGQYYAFVVGDWAKAFPLLAKGSDDQLKAIATAESANPEDADAQVKLADLWWKFAEAAKPPQQEAARQRAIEWYESAVLGLTGLDKVRVEKLLAANTASENSTPVGGTTGTKPKHTKVNAGAMTKELIDYTAQQITDKAIVRSKEPGFTLGRREFWSAPEAGGGLLVGFDLSVGTFDKVQAFRPIFQTPKGRVLGPIVGKPTAKSVRVVARDGFAVGSIAVAGGLGIDGFAVKFMQITKGGLDPEKFYVSPFFGNRREGAEELGGDGSPVIGIFGHVDDNAVSAMGVITVPKKE